MNAICYLRVSTDQQWETGHGLYAQKSALEQWVSRQDWTDGTVLWRLEAVSGKDMRNRPKLLDALQRLTSGEADTLVVAKLDRLGRSLMDIASILETARKQGWAVVALDIGLDSKTPTGQAMFGMMAVWAQLERQMISERTKAGLAAARERGVRMGSPRKIPEETAELCRKLRSEGVSFVEIGKQVGLGWTSVRKLVKRKPLVGVPKAELASQATANPASTQASSCEGTLITEN